jgi:precorrin-6B methylase 2
VENQIDRAQAGAVASEIKARSPVDAMLQKLRTNSALRSLVLAERNARSRLCDRWLGINTIAEYRQGFDPAATRFRDPIGYEPSDYLILRKYMKPVRLSSDDVVFDVGCGMGRTLCLFARCRVNKCVGIEYVPALAAAAEQNAARLRGRKAPVEIRVGDASEADYSGGTVYWIFNSFGEGTLLRVLQRIEDSLRASPRSIQLIYVNPKHESLLRSSGWLRHTGNVRSALYRTYHASYWEN